MPDLAQEPNKNLDCIATKITYVIFVKKVDELTADRIDRDREELGARAKGLDPSVLPRGFQKGVAVLSMYVADRVEESARQMCLSKPKARFAHFFVPAVLDKSSGQTFFIQGTPAWGALYYSKYRFLIRRLLEPATAPASWPLSVGGIVLGLLILLLMAVSFGLLSSF